MLLMLDVASSDPMSSFSNSVWSADEASAGGGIVLFPPLGAMCSGGGRGDTCRVGCRPGSKNLVGGDRHCTREEPLGRIDWLLTVYGVCGGGVGNRGATYDGAEMRSLAFRSLQKLG